MATMRRALESTITSWSRTRTYLSPEYPCRTSASGLGLAWHGCPDRDAEVRVVDAMDAVARDISRDLLPLILRQRQHARGRSGDLRRAAGIVLVLSRTAGRRF